MSDTALLEIRKQTELSREFVSRQLDPPISSKTLERWEKGARVKKWRLEQLAGVYGVSVDALNGKVTA